MIKAVYPYLNNFLLTLSNIYHFVVFLGKHALHKNSKLLVMIVYPAEVPTNGIYRRCPSVTVCIGTFFLRFHGYKVHLHLRHNIIYLHRALNHFVCELCVESMIFWLAIRLMENPLFTQSSVGIWSSKSKCPYTHRFSIFQYSANNTLDVNLYKDLC